MKNFHWDRKYFYAGLTAFCVIALSIVFYMCVAHYAGLHAGVKQVVSVLSPIIWGLVIAYILSPLENILEKRLFLPLSAKTMRTEKAKKRAKKCARMHSVALTEVILLLVLFTFFWLIIPQLYTSIENIVVNSSAVLSKANWWVDKTLNDYPELEAYVSSALGTTGTSVVDWLQQTLMPQLSTIVSNVTGGVYAVVKSVINIVIGIVVSIYLLAGKEKLSSGCKKIAYSIFTVPSAKKIIEAFQFADKVFMGFISGKILDSVIVGILCYIGCSILGLPYVLLVSFIVCITNVIPYFGPFIGAIPCAVLIFTVDPFQCLVFLIFILVLQQLDGNVIGPKILGNSIGISGFWVLASITVGGGLFGFIGMLLGVPVFVLIYTGLQTLINRKLERSGLPQEPQFYATCQYIDPETGEPVPKDPDRRRPQGDSFFAKIKARMAKKSTQAHKNDSEKK